MGFILSRRRRYVGLALAGIGTLTGTLLFVNYLLEVPAYVFGGILLMLITTLFIAAFELGRSERLGKSK